MEERDKSGWLDNLRAAVAVARNHFASNPRADWVAVGPAAPDADEGEGWFRVGLSRRLTNSQMDRLDEACLAPPRGTDNERYDILDLRTDQATVWVRCPAAAVRPAEGQLHLHLPQMDQRLQYEKLQKALVDLRETPAVHRFAEGALDPVPETIGPPAAVERLNRAQQAAVRACTADGLQVVWGPPGTGKTHVIGTAACLRMKQGLRVLVVSNTNVAVDNALLAILEQAEARPGAIVRVGTPEVRELGANPLAVLSSLAAAKVAGLERELVRIEEAVQTLRSNRSQEELREAQAKLAGFDASAYQRAKRRVDASQTGDLEREVTHAEASLVVARQQHTKARHAALVAHLRCAWLDDERAQATVHHAARYLEVTGEASLWERTLLRVQRREAKRAVELGNASLAQTRAAIDGAVATLYSEGHGDYRLWRPTCLTSLAEAATRAAQERDMAMQAEKQAQADLWRGEHASSQAKQRLAEAQRQPPPSAEDIALVSSADEAALPELYERLPQLEEQSARVEQQLDELGGQLEGKQAEVKRARANAEKVVLDEAQVVGATLAMLTMRPSLATQEFDHVIVDEVSAASLPHVVCALGRARRGATLVGDFLQNGPVTDPELKRSFRGQEHLWDCFARDAFQQVELLHPAQARDHRGCVVLTHQYRFGTSITSIANDAVYEGVLTSEKHGADHVVFVDVDGLGDTYTAIERPFSGGACWAIGPLLALALTHAHHVQRGESVGVIAPYRAHAGVLAATLEGDAATRLVDAGTSHRFQGRQFDTVVFDMVEDGNGWVAKGSRDGGDFALGGLRLFNVAITRARKGLYIVGRRAALHKAAAGPLRVLEQRIEDGTIATMSAERLLGLDRGGDERTGPAGASEPPVEDAILRVTRSFVRTEGIYDENVAIKEVRDRIDRATTSVFVWSPWIGRHAQDLQDSLVAAYARGVDVRVVALPPDDVSPHNRESLVAFLRRMPNVVALKRTHKKLIIIDGHIVFNGSENLLSHARYPSGRWRETVVEHDSTWFAQHLLTFELAEMLRHPPACPRCGKQLRYIDRSVPRGRRSSGSQDREIWHWLCHRKACDGYQPFRQRKPSEIRLVG